MAEFIDKGMILILCMLPAVEAGGESAPVMAFLLGLTAGALLYYLQERKQKAALCMVFFVLCFLVPELVLFLPVIFYDCVRNRFYWGVAGIVPYMICGTAGKWGGCSRSGGAVSGKNRKTAEVRAGNDTSQGYQYGIKHGAGRKKQNPH